MADPPVAGDGMPALHASWRDRLSIDDIRAAADRLAPVGVRTPLQRSERLSMRYGAEIYLKREDLQAVRSYKIRGAFNFIASLPDGAPGAGVVCASAGNHAQGVAWSCQHLGVRGTVFLPRRTPRQKVDRIRAIGADEIDVRFAGRTMADALVAANEFARTTGATIVSAFDDPITVAGQGTVMLEILEQLRTPPDVVLVPIGGGGLIAGVAVCVDGMHVPTAVVGVQPAGAPAMVQSLEAGEPVVIDVEDDFVDGAVMRTPGRLGYAVVADLVDAVHVVPEGRVCTVLLDLYQDDGIIAEPAGALSITALDDIAGGIAGRTVVCLLSGGNNDVARYDDIIERSLVDRGLKHYFIVQLPEQPGSLRRFVDECLGPGDDLSLFEALRRHRREFGAVLVGIEVADKHELGPLLERMDASGIDYERLVPGTVEYQLLV